VRNSNVAASSAARFPLLHKGKRVRMRGIGRVWKFNFPSPLPSPPDEGEGVFLNMFFIIGLRM
jgi:hypothetical protein